MTETILKRATRIATIAKTVPQTWTDSKPWREDDLRAVSGLIAARYRVNGDSPLDRVYIVKTINAELSFEVLESWGIRDARSFFLIAVRSDWGAHFPDVHDEEQAARVIDLAENPANCGGTIEAIFRHGRNERDDTPFVFGDWTGGGTMQETGKPVTTSSMWTPEAETEGRRILTADRTMSSNDFVDKVGGNRTVAQSLYRHITGKKKRATRTD